MALHTHSGFLLLLFLLCSHKLVEKCKMKRFPFLSKRIPGPGLHTLGSGVELLCSSVPGSCGSVGAPQPRGQSLLWAATPWDLGFLAAGARKPKFWVTFWVREKTWSKQ